MVLCDYCGEEIQPLSTFTCSYCKKIFCPKHRLPFNHNCTHIEAWRQTPPSGQQTYQAKKQAPREPMSPSNFAGEINVQQKTYPLIISLGIALLIATGIIIGVYLLTHFL